MLIKGTFTSVWDGGTEITTPAELDTETGEVTAECSDEDPDCSLICEYFTDTKNDEDYEVCPDCHNFVLKSAMVEGVGKTLNEVRVCSDPDCESNQ